MKQLGVCLALLEPTPYPVSGVSTLMFMTVCCILLRRTHCASSAPDGFGFHSEQDLCFCVFSQTFKYLLLVVFFRERAPRPYMKQFGSWDIYYSIIFVTDLCYLCLFKDYFMTKFISSFLTVECLTWIYPWFYREKRRGRF